jgi:hypothetical protein
MVRYIQEKDKPTEINVRSYTGDGSTIVFAVSQNQSVNKVIVTENGVIQKPTDDYIITGTNLVFTTAPASNVQIIIREMPI